MAFACIFKELYRYAIHRAFAAVETVESIYALAHSSDVTPLSIQETLDCSYTYDSILYSCYGGDTCAAFDWMNEVFTTGVTVLPTELVYLSSDCCNMI